MEKETIAVIGAGGRSGQAFVAAALDAGYRVRAGIRSSSLKPSSNLEIIHCDATNPQEVASLIRGSTIVVSLIGHVRHSPSDVQTKATRVIIEQMRLLGISRFVSLTGTGVRQSMDRPSLVDKLANTAISILDHERIEDGIAHAKEIANSPLDWTIVRVLKLTNGPAGNFSLTPQGPAKTFTSRKEVAQAILQIIADKQWIHLYPVISRQNASTIHKT